LRQPLPFAAGLEYILCGVDEGAELRHFGCASREVSSGITIWLLRGGQPTVFFAPGEGEVSIDLIEPLPNDTEPLVIGRLVISTLANLKQGAVLLFDSEPEGIVVVNLSFPGTGVNGIVPNQPDPCRAYWL
jgi:hypothetical protein